MLWYQFKSIQTKVNDFKDNRVICKVKEMKSWVYVKTLSLWELTQSNPNFSMIKLSYIENGLGLLKLAYTNYFI